MGNQRLMGGDTMVESPHQTLSRVSKGPEKMETTKSTKKSCSFPLWTEATVHFATVAGMAVVSSAAAAFPGGAFPFFCAVCG